VNNILRRNLELRQKQKEEESGKNYNEELHNLYCSHKVIKVNKNKEDDIDRVCSTHGRDEKCI
jgi:hypothetical protein